jgi:hypothetical protein
MVRSDCEKTFYHELDESHECESSGFTISAIGVIRGQGSSLAYALTRRVGIGGQGLSLAYASGWDVLGCSFVVLS